MSGQHHQETNLENNPTKEAPKGNILVIEDQREISDLICYHLSEEGYSCTACYDGIDAIDTAVQLKPDLILLDLMLPRLDGLEVCRRLRNREETKNTQIIILTAKSQENDQLEGLKEDIDDYLTKPFSPKILRARVNKYFEKQQTPSLKVAKINHQGIELNDTTKSVSIENKVLKLTKSEYDILKLFLTHPGKVFSRADIVDTIRGKNFSVTERSVDFQIVGLRRKLKERKDLLETVRGCGYRLLPIEVSH